MYGRYGGDKFSLFLLVIALVISFAGAFFWPISLVADAIFIYVLFRMFSRNHAARQREYYGFLRFWTPIEKWFTFQRTRFAGAPGPGENPGDLPKVPPRVPNQNLKHPRKT